MGVRGEVFSTRVMLPNRTYFFNVKENRLGDLYLNIVESKNKETGGFDRQSVILFADDLQEFLKGFDESLRVMEKAVREKRRGTSSGREEKTFNRDKPDHEEKVFHKERPPREDKPYHREKLDREDKPYRSVKPVHEGKPFRRDNPDREGKPFRREKPHGERERGNFSGERKGRPDRGGGQYSPGNKFQKNFYKDRGHDHKPEGGRRKGGKRVVVRKRDKR
jgi:hypothetical protein